jgi:hypothetical protein
MRVRDYESDTLIVPMKRRTKAADGLAEVAEGRGVL